MQPETIINLVAGGALAAFLAKLLQAQYEARIADYKERIKEQSGLLASLTTGIDKVQDQLAALSARLDPPRSGKGE